MSSWLDKYTEARTLGDLATESLRNQDLSTASQILLLAIQKYTETLEMGYIPDLVRNSVKQQIATQRSKLKMIRRISKNKLMREIESKHSPQREYKTRRGK
jgi:hypothetical protein